MAPTTREFYTMRERYVGVSLTAMDEDAWHHVLTRLFPKKKDAWIQHGEWQIAAADGEIRDAAIMLKRTVQHRRQYKEASHA